MTKKWKLPEFRNKFTETHTGKNNNQSKQVYIDGNVYDTATEAYNTINPSCKYVAFCQRLRSKSNKYKTWYYV